MAIYKLQPMIPQPIGSLGGTTFQRIGKSFAIKKRYKPVDKQTIKQFEKRQVFASVATNWRELSGAEQTSFINEAPNYPRVNSLGNPYTITGDNLQQSSNVIMVQAAQPQITTMPAPVVFPVWSVGLPEFYYGTKECFVPINLGSIPANFVWQVWIANPSPAFTIGDDAPFVLLRTFAPAETPGTTNIYSEFESFFGDNPNYVGLRSPVRVRMASTLTGQFDGFIFTAMIMDP